MPILVINVVNQKNSLFELKDIPIQSKNYSSSFDYEDRTINELENDLSE